MPIIKDETWLDAGQLFQLDASLSAEDKRNVLLCSLYFQLAASRKADKLQDPDQWFEAYQGCLQALGWRVARSGQYRKQFSAGLTFTWPEILQGLVHEGMPLNLQGVAQVLQPGRGLSEPASGRLAAHSVGRLGKGAKARQQVAVLMAVAHSSGSVDLLLVHFQTRQPIAQDITQARFDSSELQSEITASWLITRPDPLLFPEFREEIHERLKGRADHHLLRIDEGPCHVRT